nr:MAG TPA: hypothetical protein [Caudoviricetes sp.]
MQATFSRWRRNYPSIHRESVRGWLSPLRG